MHICLPMGQTDKWKPGYGYQMTRWAESSESWGGSLPPLTLGLGLSLWDNARIQTRLSDIHGSLFNELLLTCTLPLMLCAGLPLPQSPSWRQSRFSPPPKHQSPCVSLKHSPKVKGSAELAGGKPGINYRLLIMFYS